jgi:hypothetical protein
VLGKAEEGGVTPAIVMPPVRPVFVLFVLEVKDGPGPRRFTDLGKALTTSSIAFAKCPFSPSLGVCHGCGYYDGEDVK